MTDMRFAKNADLGKGRWKTKRRVMRSFKLGEISGVDNPAQEGARVVMMKIAPQTPASLNEMPLIMAKAAFAQIFAEQKQEQEISEAFYEAMDDRWKADNAFREALKGGADDDQANVDEYVAAVRLMANDAVAAIRAAREGGQMATDEAMKSQVAKAIGEAKLISFAKHTKELPMFKTLAELKAAIAKYNTGDRTITKADLRKAAIDLDSINELTGDLAMTPAADPAIETLKRENAELKMAPDVRKHYDGLDDAAKATFIAKSASDQQAEVDALTKGDPIVYTAKDGTQIRKSDGAMVLMMAKNFDNLNDRLDKVEKGQVANEFEKRAKSEFSYLPTGSTVALLKAAENMEKAEADEVVAGLRIANKAAKPKFERLGHNPVAKDYSPEDSDDDGHDRFDAMAKASMAKDAKLTYEQAYEKAMLSSEGRSVYNEAVGFESE